jgi:hypothetical protein
MIRGMIVAASLLMLVSTSSAKPKKKKGSTSSSKHKEKEKEKDASGGGGEIEMGSEGSTPAPETAPTPPPETPETPAPVASARPLQINDRPLTMAKGKVEAHGGLPISRLSLPDGMGGSTSSVGEGLAVGASYGIDDKLEVGGDYALSLNPGSAKGPLTLHGAYHVVHDAKLDIAIAGAFVVHPIDSTDLVTMNTTTTTYAALDLGAWVRYRVAPKVSLFAGLPALPHGSVSLSRLSFALPPQPYQVVIGLNHKGAIAFGLPAGVGIQATPQIYAFASITLLQLNLSNTQNAFLFRDFIPIALGGFYSLDKLDLGASFATDGNRKQGANFLSFVLSARSYF